MSKKKTVRTAKPVSKKVLNEAQLPAPMMNSLSEALGVGGGLSLQQIVGGMPNPNAVVKVDTIFKNLRGYLVSNFRQMLSQAYVEIGLLQTLCDVPVDDGLRGGVMIKSDQLDEGQILELTKAVERDDDLRVVGQAAKWNRLFGGAAVLILTDQDPETPLEIENIGEDDFLKFRAVDMWELFFSLVNTSDEDFDDPDPYAADLDNVEFYNYYGVKVHKSRVLRMKGLEAPSWIRPRLRGWGFSVVEKLVRSINQYLKGTDLVFEVLDEFKVDVYKIKGLTQMLFSPQGIEAMKQRVQIANWEKNYQNALTMDSEDDWDHKQLQFTGIADAMEQIRMQVAADMRFPLTKLFGLSAAGFNSGEDDIEVYNAMVESDVRAKIKPPIVKLLEIKCQKKFGFVPDDLSVEFQPLRVMSSEQEENCKNAKMSRLVSAIQIGGISMEEYRDACNKSKLFDITLEQDQSIIDQYEERQAVQLYGTEDEGVDPPDSKKSKDPAKSPEAPKHKKNSLTVIPKPFTRSQLVTRMLRNSAAYDRKVYLADGGDDWIDSRREQLFTGSKAKDKQLWARAHEATLAAFGEDRWQFQVWWYRKHGGKF